MAAASSSKEVSQVVSGYFPSSINDLGKVKVASMSMDQDDQQPVWCHPVARNGDREQAVILPAKNSLPLQKPGHTFTENA